MKKCNIVFVFLFLLGCANLISQNLEKQIGDSLTSIANKFSYIGKVNDIKINVDKKNTIVTVAVPEKLSYIPFRTENVDRIYAALKKILKPKYNSYEVICTTNGQPIEELIPNYFRKGKADSTRLFSRELMVPPVVTPLSRAYTATEGLNGRHLALWPSHGWYYSQPSKRWEWQRGRFFGTVEDLLPLSYVLTFLAPMLENAGAYVLMPRERDLQKNEVIVDNDDKRSKSTYKEYKKWNRSDNDGFANPYEQYVFRENPFKLGTYATKKTVSEEDNAGFVEWKPIIPEAGHYAVYISYKSLDNSATDAQYTVFHRGGKTEFSINQTMGGGTWIYLGTFDFIEGQSDNQKVVLSAYSAEQDKVITADAVRFGGGMGNIARSPMDTVYRTDNLKPIYEPEISRYPRWAEGARYWLQWAGAPDTVYSRTQGLKDYQDDFQSRGFWVNWLAGGSSAVPDAAGLHIPIDMALAFHTDAGVTENDSVIGTLGIFSVSNTNKGELYKNGVSRWAARDLADIIQTQIVNDVRSEFNPSWARRNLWNRSYSESREPEVPTMILEMLSHQNFSDMRYALDPRFQFTVSRAIYKGILKYIARNNNELYIVQPLPVTKMSSRIDNGKVKLHWEPSIDSLESSAVAEKYIIYTRIDDGGFDNGVLVDNSNYEFEIENDKIYSFKVTAVNKGGESFPSEILSVCQASKSKGEVLIVNGFDRLASPMSFEMGKYAGILTDIDPGMAYHSNINFTGNQYIFDRKSEYAGNDLPGFGASYANYETMTVAGNSFDYPYLHGKSIFAAGYSFVSCSAASVETNNVDLKQYKIVDFILGNQKKGSTDNFYSFSANMQNAIKSYTQNGGNLMVSGSYFASDLSSKQGKAFLEDVLKIKLRNPNASVTGAINTVSSPYIQFKKNSFYYYWYPNQYAYYVNCAQALEPMGSGAYVICRYNENNQSAAVAYSGVNKLCVFGFPFEAIIDNSDRKELMKEVLAFFQSDKNK